jgi:hypothetical protein
MTATQIHLCERLKRLGFRRENQTIVKMAGQQMEVAQAA